MRDPTPQARFAAAALVLGLFMAAPGAALGQQNCTCRYAGESYALGTCVCIETPNGVRTACCGMVLNNTSWAFKTKGCPVALAPDPAGGDSQPGNAEWRTATAAE